MVLVGGDRRLEDVNGAFLRLVGYARESLLGRFIYELVPGQPAMSEREWRSAVTAGQFTGTAQLRCADESVTSVQFAATSEVVTGRYLVLAVVIGMSRWGDRFRRPSTLAGHDVPLSGRERQIVTLVALGGTGPEIADELGIAHDTVRTHVRNAMDKLDARSRAHLVAKVLGEGLVLAEELPLGAKRWE